MSKKYDIKSFIISEDTYDRMTSFVSMNYNEFLIWNKICIDKLNIEDQNWIQGLLLRMETGKINVMDEESCVPLPVHRIYFDGSGKLFITSPR